MKRTGIIEFVRIAYLSLTLFLQKNVLKRSVIYIKDVEKVFGVVSI